MARIHAVSGLGGKGPACFLVETRRGRLLLDLGYGPQPGLLPDVSRVGAVDAVLLPHGHRDHAGGLALLPQLGSPPVYATDIVARALPAALAARVLPLRGAAEVLGIAVTTGRSGHAPGGAWLHLAVDGGLLYMGDYSVESPLYAYDAPPPARALILDASYGVYDAALGDNLPAFERLFDAGPVLLPVPPAGRGPEIALHLARSGRPLPRIDEAMRAALHRLAGPDRVCLQPGVAADLERLAQAAGAAGEPEGVTLAGAADAASGTAAALVGAWRHAAAPAIVFTGYLPPGTPAEHLTRSGRAQYLRWNVHPRLSDNRALVRDTGAELVLPAFGDARHGDAWQRAFAPARVVLQGAATF
jgi:glyoxylase-like metal-dependent hydrolase (beta-lactamase superfamily II)